MGKKNRGPNKGEEKAQHHRDGYECNGQCCTDNAKENCMQDHINKRIPTLLTIMLTEAQSAIENCWVKKEKEAQNTKPKQQKTSRNYKSAPNKKKRITGVYACALTVNTPRTGFPFLLHAM